LYIVSHAVASWEFSNSSNEAPIRLDSTLTAQRALSTMMKRSAVTIARKPGMGGGYYAKGGPDKVHILFPSIAV
jgi:hypothetical protein